MSNDGNVEAIEQSVQTDTPDEAASAADAPPASTEEQRVPLDRFRSVTAENKELRSQLDELAKWKEEQEQAQLTELERERQAREKAEAAAAEAADRAQSLERGTWLRSAATAAGFADPDDAVALIGTAAAEDADTAARLVKELADKKPHLLNQAQSGPAPLGAPLGGVAPSVDPDDPKAGLGADLLTYLRGGKG